MKIEVLGTGCPKCSNLETLVKQAVSELGLEAEIIKIKDINTMIDKGVMQTPALIIDNNLVLQGKVPSAEEIKNIIQSGGQRR